MAQNTCPGHVSEAVQMVYRITISGLKGTEPNGKLKMKRENELPDVGLGRSATSSKGSCSKSVSYKDVCTNAMKPGKSVTRDAMSAGVKRYKVIEKPSLVQADAVESDRQLSNQHRGTRPTTTVWSNRITVSKPT